MTRKCALCKETNYKNNYSFFSAPKDPETRKKWQKVLENYVVTNDTYVCSRHFYKNDIITHWVSGVPPQVIKIKYKKCRLRPGAVPYKNIHSVNNSQMIDRDVISRCEATTNSFLTSKGKKTLDLLNKEKAYVIPRQMKTLSDNKCTSNENINVCYHQTYSKLRNCTYTSETNDESDNVRLMENIDQNNVDVFIHDTTLKKSRFIKKELNIYKHDNSSNIAFTEAIEFMNANKEQNHSSKKSSYMEAFKKTVKCNIKRYDSSEEDATSIDICKHNLASTDSYLTEKSIDNFKMIDNFYTNDEILTTYEILNYNPIDTHKKSLYDEVSVNEILFEDFLEICTEVSIPRGWSCLVTSQGHNTTVVYLYMGITKDGMPFVEKQVFLRSDMILHYAAANKEIDPFVYNLIKEGKHIKIKNLLDIEELVEEFDQRNVCQGIYDSKNYEGITNLAYKDGVKWRHISCPLIVNNDAIKCTKCVALSRTLIRKTQKMRMLQQIQRHIKKNITNINA